MQFLVRLLVAISVVSCSAQSPEQERQPAVVSPGQPAWLPDYFRYSFSACLKEWQAHGNEYDRKKCAGVYGQFSEELAFADGDLKEVPLVKVSATDSFGSNQTREVFIYIHGGPLRSFPRLYEFEDQFKGLDASQVVYFPIYQGTWFRSSGDAVEDIEAAVVELRYIISALRAQYQYARFVIIGESWGGYIASRQELLPDDKLVLESAPLNHTGNSLADFFSERSSEAQKNATVSFPLDASDYSKQLNINKFQYVNAALRHIDDQEFVLDRQPHDTSCRIIFYGKRDPMLASFDRADGFSIERNEWIISRETGHDVLEGLDGFFKLVSELECGNHHH